MSWGLIIFLVIIIKIIDNILWHSLYVALSRPLLGFAVGIMIYGISEGVEGLNNFSGNWNNFLTNFLGLSKKILEWPPTYILGKLTFSLYLVHISLIFWRVGMTRYPSYVSDSQIVSFLWKLLIFANLVVFFLSFLLLWGICLPLLLQPCCWLYSLKFRLINWPEVLKTRKADK